MVAVLRQIRVLVVAAAGAERIARDGRRREPWLRPRQAWCATLHVVNSEQKQASTDAPPFAVIARKSGFTPEKIAFFLLGPHPKMPSFPLSRSEAADLAAYIGTQRK